MSITLLRTKVRIFFGLKKNSEGKNKKYLGERIGKIQERGWGIKCMCMGGGLYNQFAVTEKGIFRIPVYCFY